MPVHVEKGIALGKQIKTAYPIHSKKNVMYALIIFF
jgi:hypothetical protein